jgi:hypothetical protein
MASQCFDFIAIIFPFLFFRYFFRDYIKIYETCLRNRINDIDEINHQIITLFIQFAIELLDKLSEYLMLLMSPPYQIVMESWLEMIIQMIQFPIPGIPLQFMMSSSSSKSSRKKKSHDHHDAVFITFQQKFLSFQLKLRKKMNKTVKNLLKHGLNSSLILQFFHQFSSLAISGDEISPSTDNIKRPDTIWKLVFDRPSNNNEYEFYSCKIMLEMIISHSQYLPVLYNDINPNDIHRNNITNRFIQPNTHLLLLVLVLLNGIATSLETKNINLSEDDDFRMVLLSIGSSLIVIYYGSLSVTDRIILRIFFHLRNYDILPPLETLTLSSDGLVLSRSDSMNGPTVKSNEVMAIKHWLLSSFTFTNISATISSYPTWRLLIPQPLHFEGKHIHDNYDHSLQQLYHDSETHWRSYNNHTNEMMKPNKDDDNVSEVNDDQSTAMSVDDIDLDIITRDADQRYDHSSDQHHDDSSHCFRLMVDDLSHDSSTIYDPSFWLPCIHYCLMTHRLSVRLMASKGILSYLIVTLSSHCSLLRTYALACLTMVRDLIEEQHAEVDPSFRERPQLKLLLQFIRDAIPTDVQKTHADEPIQLPFTTSIFLARAAMILLQPAHENYSKTNRYLVRRPFCDIKDIPLFDLILPDGDNTDGVNDRIQAFRLLRDGLQSHADHLNLCRKNAYVTMLLLFSIFMKDDHKLCHIILDILEKGLRLKESARYLIQRCGITKWLHGLSIPSLSIRMTRGDHQTQTESTTVDTMKMEENLTTRDSTDDIVDPHLKSSHLSPSDTSIYHPTNMTISKDNRTMAAPISMLNRMIQLQILASGSTYLLHYNNLLHINYVINNFTNACHLVDDFILVEQYSCDHHIPTDVFKSIISLLWHTRIFITKAFSESDSALLASSFRFADMNDETYLTVMGILNKYMKLGKKHSEHCDVLILYLLMMPAMRTATYRKQSNTSLLSIAYDDQHQFHLVQRYQEIAMHITMTRFITKMEDSKEDYKGLYALVSRPHLSDQSSYDDKNEHTISMNHYFCPFIQLLKRYHDSNRPFNSHNDDKESSILWHLFANLPTDVQLKTNNYDMRIVFSIMFLSSLMVYPRRVQTVPKNMRSSNLSFLRWIFIVYSSFYYYSYEHHGYSDIPSSNQRLWSACDHDLCAIVDENYHYQYTDRGIDYQLLIRLTMNAIFTFLYTTASSDTIHIPSDNEGDITLSVVFIRILEILLHTSIDETKLSSYTSVIAIITRLLRQADCCIGSYDGSYYYDMSDDSTKTVRVAVEEVCHHVMRLLIRLITNYDRGVSPGLNPDYCHDELFQQNIRNLNRLVNLIRKEVRIPSVSSLEADDTHEIMSQLHTISADDIFLPPTGHAIDMILSAHDRHNFSKRIKVSYEDNLDNLSEELLLKQMKKYHRPLSSSNNIGMNESLDDPDANDEGDEYDEDGGDDIGMTNEEDNADGNGDAVDINESRDDEKYFDRLNQQTKRIKKRKVVKRLNMRLLRQRSHK